MSQPLRFSGVMPANVLPFTADLAIDEPAYRGHLRWLADALQWARSRSTARAIHSQSDPVTPVPGVHRST